MRDDEMTPGEVHRAFDRIEAELTAISSKLGSIGSHMTSDYYHLDDHERRLARIEKGLVAVASAVLLAIVVAVIDLVIKR